MTTLHVDLGRQWRGGQSQALLLMRGLVERGHGADLVARAGSPLAGRAAAAGIKVYPLWHLLHTEPYALVHCHDANGLTAAWAAGAGRQSRLVASRRVAYPLARNPLAKARYRAARIVAVSQFVRASVIASGLPGEQVEVVYDGVELPEPAGPRIPSRRLGCVGYLLAEKGQELLIRALPLVLARYPDASLMLAGDGPCRARLERLAAELGIAPAVEFAGHVEDVAAVYRSLDVFLFPSLAEPLGSALLTAMAYGLPVVARPTGAVPEVIEDGGNGLFAGEEPGAFAGVVLRVLDDAELAARLGAAARLSVEQRFSADAMIQGTLQVYHRVLAC